METECSTFYYPTCPRCAKYLAPSELHLAICTECTWNAREQVLLKGG